MTISQKFAETFKEFPIIQKRNTFTIDDAIKAMEDTVGGAGQ
jgi:arylsulfatase